jgi:hypothetical protein
MSVKGGPNTVTFGLVLELDAGNIKSYQSGSTTWFDKSGNANNGTLTNGPTFNTGSLGSIVFDGVDDYVNCGNPSTVQFEKTSPFTLGIWFKHTFSASCNILSKQSNTSPNFTGWGLGMNGSGTRLQFFTYNNGSGRVVDFPSAYNNGTWNYVVVTYDGTDTIPGINFYVNSTNVGLSTILINSQPSTIVSTASLQISGRAGTNNIWGGTVSLAQIYNRALSADEVLQNYNATKGRFGL